MGSHRWDQPLGFLDTSSCNGSEGQRTYRTKAFNESEKEERKGEMRRPVSGEKGRAREERMKSTPCALSCQRGLRDLFQLGSRVQNKSGGGHSAGRGKERPRHAWGCRRVGAAGAQEASETRGDRQPLAGGDLAPRPRGPGSRRGPRPDPTRTGVRRLVQGRPGKPRGSREARPHGSCGSLASSRAAVPAPGEGAARCHFTCAQRVVRESHGAG